MTDERSDTISRPDASSDGNARSGRLPGFVSDAEIGLGDVVTKTFSALGVRPCDGCRKRAEMLNRWVTLKR